ncbi:hypothetical protein ACA910_010948 [Epithemia clementina (nom. ined.)]
MPLLTTLLPTATTATTTTTTITTTPLSRAIQEGQWTLVQHILAHDPRQAQVASYQAGFFDGTLTARVWPLHQVLVQTTTNPPPPLAVVRALIQAYPAALAQPESSYERLPLHCACRCRPPNSDNHNHNSSSAHLEIVTCLVQAYPQACLIPDALQRLPLHYALTNQDSNFFLNDDDGDDGDRLIHYLLQVHPEAARGVDIRGFTPLHVACAQLASPALIGRLLDYHPAALYGRLHNGSSVTQCLPPLRSSPKPTITTTTNASSRRKLEQRRHQILVLLQDAQQRFPSPPLFLPNLEPKNLIASYNRSVWV